MIDFKKALEKWKQAGKPELTEEHIEGIFKMVDANKLSRLSAMWKKVVPIQPSFSNVADGDYVGDIKEMKLADAKKSGRLQVESTIEIVDGEFEGKTVKRFDGVEEETGMGYFKNVCEVIGLDLPDDMRMWQEAMDTFVGDPNRVDLYDITVKTNNNYANVYINGISEYAKTGAEGEQVAEEATEEVASEEVAEEEVVEEELEVVEEQQVVVPTRRVIPKPVARVAQPVARVVTQPMKKAVVTQPVKKVAQPVATGGRKIVSLQRK